MRSRNTFIALFLLVFCWPAQAQMQTEIDHLLAYLADSGCIYVRNGKQYSAEEAVEHIMKKYRYFEDDIDSAERFIELSASQSTMSGKPYLIRCPLQPEQRSRDWLLAELERFRAGPR